MTEDHYADGYQRWEARYKEAPPEVSAVRPDIEREVEIAVAYYREKFGTGNANVLDLGAGDGRHTLYLAQQGFRVTAVDAAPSGIERIRQRAEALQVVDRIQLEVADLRQYPLPAQVDLLLASYVIHLLPEPLTFLKRWQDCTRPGGLCVVSTRKRFPNEPEAEHYWFPEDFELMRLFEEAGWYILHAREEDNWRPEMGHHFRSRAVVAVKPE